MHIIPFVIVCVYIVALYLISWYSTKLSKGGGEKGYLLAGRGFTTPIVAVMLTGLAVGGASTVGVAENAYKAGISAGWYNGAWATAGILAGLIVASRYRSMSITTIPELFEHYYSKSGRFVGALGQLLVGMVITSLQYIAGGAVLTALLPEFFTQASGMAVTALVFIGITLIGGMWAAGLTNIINVIVIYVGVVTGAIMSVVNFGGLEQLKVALPANGTWFDPVSGVGIAAIGAWFAVMISQAFSLQATVQISFAAKSSKTARNGFVLGGLLIFPIGFVSAIFGIVAAAQFPGIIPTNALPSVVLTLNPVIAGLTLAGLWAADVSTASVLLLGNSALVVQDIIKRNFIPHMSEKQGLLYSRITVLIISALTYIMATMMSGILKTITIALTIMSAYTVIMLFTMFAPKLCRKSSAFWTLLTGMLFLLIWQLVPATHIVPHAVFLAWPIAIVTFLLTTVLDPRRATIPEVYINSENSLEVA